jgi:hypothetical protein
MIWDDIKAFAIETGLTTEQVFALIKSLKPFNEGSQ